MKTSVLIPCHPAHFVFLENLLQCHTQQTVVPDEVVVSLSQGWKIPERDRSHLTSREWPFKLILLSHPHKVGAGENRSMAADHSSGDLLICQDADDLPHPQRIEIIKHLFEHFEIDHLLHQEMHGPPRLYSMQECEAACFDPRVHETKIFLHGPVAITRSVFEKVRWGKKLGIGEDLLFNKEVGALFPHLAILEIGLMSYRLELSTHFLDQFGRWRTRD